MMIWTRFNVQREEHEIVIEVEHLDKYGDVVESRDVIDKGMLMEVLGMETTDG
jgi:hypothetical protein